MTARPAFEAEAETVGVAVTHRKTVDGEIARVEHRSRRQRNELERNGRPPLAPESRKHPDHDIEGAGTPMDRHDLAAPPQAQRREQPGDAKHMIEMGVRQQQPIEPSEACAAPQQLALRALAAIDHDAMPACFHEQSRMIALRRWHAGGGAEESQVEHDRERLTTTAFARKLSRNCQAMSQATLQASLRVFACRRTT